jgi:hypothetical protein
VIKQGICILVLAMGIQGAVHAQRFDSTNRRQRTFELPKNYINRRYYIELGDGNEIQLGLNSLKDLNHIGNLDSLLRVFLLDLAPFKDSFPDELSSKRIDYRVDETGRRELRIRQLHPEGSSFVFQQHEIAALKLEQDSVHILAPVHSPSASVDPRIRELAHQFEIYILVNELAELPGLMAAGLQGKIDTLRMDQDWSLAKPGWKWVRGKNHLLHLNKDSSIGENHQAGALTPNSDHLGFGITGSIQNYKNYFVPAFGLGVDVLFNSSPDMRHKQTFFSYAFSLNWEPQFFFQNNQGNLRTLRNDFLTFGVESIRNGQFRFRFINSTTIAIPFRFTLAYLINREGPFYDKNTFRLGTGAVSFLEGKFKLEPVIYFSNLFKGVTPGFRLQASF